ncbi:MAG: hypothetical protein J6J36_04195 [Clostridia bacterium]|nr:hypothetical protein [Clostridia bacterium]
MDKKNQTIDDKILIEMEYIDNAMSNSLFKIIGNIEQSEGIEEKDEKVATNESNSSESTKKQEGAGDDKQGESQSEETAKEISSMSMQHKEMGENEDKIWEVIKKSTEDLCTSWSVIESDINVKGGVNEKDLRDVNKSIDNLINDSTNKDAKMYLKDSADLYDKMKNILMTINVEKEKANVFEIKKNLYKAYFYAMNDEWSNVSDCINTANNQINKMSNINDKTKIVFKNLLAGIEQENKKIFYIRCSDALNDIEYIDIKK